jgi:PAS domain S-box-containing protein
MTSSKNTTFKLFDLIKLILPLLISLFSFSILIFISFNYFKIKKDTWEKDVKSNLLEILMTKKTRLEKALFSRIYYTKSVAAYVSLHPDISNDEFYNLAYELVQNDSVISTMSISQNCVIDAIYPLSGHEAAIGLDLLAHPKRKEIVQKTIDTHKPFISGPVELVEGGIAFISYNPVFDKTSPKMNNFWGMTDIVIYKDKLLEEADINEVDGKFLFSIRGTDGSGSKGAVWFGDSDVFNKNPIEVDIDLPYGSWVLAAVPVVGWDSYLKKDNVLLIILIVSSLIISVLIWLFSRAMVKIKQNQLELQAIFNSMDSLIIEYDEKGTYLNIPRSQDNLLYLPKEQLLNKTVYEVFDDKTAEDFHEAINKCLKTGKLVEIEYPLMIKGKKIWFLARLSKKSKNTVIYHAFDITKNKLERQKLIDSEKKMQELNFTKDKLFSVIAHDLKSPFNTLLGLSALLSSDYNLFDDPKRQELIAKIQDVSQNTFNLLENLLFWANSKRDKIEIIKDDYNLLNLVLDSISAYKQGALNKNQDVVINIGKDMNIYTDEFSLRIIIANLFNNAVKFTPDKGTITVDAKQGSSDIEICVSDNGIGIAPDKLETLFTLPNNLSSKGTNNESGTGIGLQLCHELIVKNGGKIWAKSKVGKGSRFCISLPVK